MQKQTETFRKLADCRLAGAGARSGAKAEAGAEATQEAPGTAPEAGTGAQEEAVTATGAESEAAAEPCKDAKDLNDGANKAAAEAGKAERFIA